MMGRLYFKQSKFQKAMDQYKNILRLSSGNVSFKALAMQEIANTFIFLKNKKSLKLLLLCSLKLWKKSVGIFERNDILQ